MPPRSYYVSPRDDDYIAYFTAYFPDELDRCKYFLKHNGLPYIGDVNHLAAYIGISPFLLNKIINNIDYHYENFDINKKNGNKRVISAPKTYLKVIQWWILDNILSKLKFNDNVYGFVSGKNYIDNAKFHYGKKHLLNVDVKSFFDSISINSVMALFGKIGYSAQVSALLSRLCTYNNKLPTGAPTSPTLANLYFSEIDDLIDNITNKHNIFYTRYADDLTFSAQEKIDSDFIILIKEVLLKFDLYLNDDKTKFMGPGSRQEVTGIVVNSVLGMPKGWRNSTRGFIHAVRMDPKSFVSRINEVYGLYGTLIYLDPDKKRTLTKQACEAINVLKEYKMNHETK